MSKFELSGTLSFFEKSGAPADRRRRIAGIISTEIKDKQDERVLQDGLDFTYFLSKGWFNDNHGKKTGDVLGYPERVKKFAKGERLPDGKLAKSNCTWAEGYLLGTPEANRVWDIAQDLKKSGHDNARSLGFSLEGDVKGRSGPEGKTVTRAVIRNVAITHCPIGEETRLDAIEKCEQLVKALTMGDGAGDGVPDSPATGDSAGAVLAHESVEGHHKLEVNRRKKKDDDDEKPVIDLMTKSEAVEYVRKRLTCSPAQADRAFRAIFAMMEKSMSKPTSAALDEALGALEKSALGSGSTRSSDLLAKASAGTITTAEREELAKSLTGGGSLAKEATKGFQSDTMEKSVDSSEYLADHAKATLSGFKVLADHLEKSDVSENQFRAGMAKVMRAQNDLIKSLVDKVDTFGDGAARPAKSVGVPANGTVPEPLNKSFDGGSGATPTLVKSLDGKEWPVLPLRKAISTMSDMLIKGNVQTICNIPIEKLVGRAEATHEIDPAVLGEVAKWRAANGG